jgi:hypothetical protein
MRIWLGMVTCTAMAGCAQPHTPISAPMIPARNVQAEMEATAVRCEKQHPMDKDRKPMTPFMACFMDAEVQYWTGKNEFRRTVALQSKAESLAIAEQYDAGKISRQRLQAELQLVGARSNEKIASAAAQHATLEQQQQAMRQQQSMALLAAGAKAMAPPPTITCSTFGNTTTCR